jgi:hypothetical protein
MGREPRSLKTEPRIERSARSLMARSRVAIVATATFLSYNVGAVAQTTPMAPVENAAPTADNAILLTIFMKHDQSRPLGELNAQLERQGFYKAFPPPGIEVVSWYVMMGVGQVVTLRLPASRLREVSQPNFRNHRLGHLSHRILSDL